MPTIVGVIERYLRDQTWSVNAPRRLRERATSLRRLRPLAEQRLGRSPTVAELADAAGVPEERLLEALEVDSLYDSSSLDSRPAECDDEDGPSVMEALGRPDPAYALLDTREMVRHALSRLDARERSILEARFFRELSQSQVAAELGISQMHVSRLERRALLRLKQMPSRVSLPAVPSSPSQARAPSPEEEYERQFWRVLLRLAERLAEEGEPALAYKLPMRRRARLTGKPELHPVLAECDAALRRFARRHLS